MDEARIEYALPNPIASMPANILVDDHASTADSHATLVLFEWCDRIEERKRVFHRGRTRFVRHEVMVQNAKSNLVLMMDTNIIYKCQSI
jgi:hypothetical protein